MQFTKIPTNTFQSIQMNAGIFVDTFNPATMEIGNILGATTGGNKFSDTPSFKDLGEDIDNCPKNTMELKMLDSREIKSSGTFVTVSPAMAKMLAAAADIDGLDSTHVVPRNDLSPSDFSDFWWIGDYSDVNDGSNAGYLAIHMKNVLSTGGFQLQSADKDKGKFAYEYTAHYSMSAPDTVPYEMYIKQGAGVSISLNKSTTSLVVGGAGETLTATVVPSGSTVNWVSDNRSVCKVSNAGALTAVAAGTATITASVTVGGTTKSATCVVTVTAS